MVGRVTAFQPGGPGSILDGVKNFNFYPGTGLGTYSLCAVSGGGLDVLLTTDSGSLLCVSV